MPSLSIRLRMPFHISQMWHSVTDRLVQARLTVFPARRHFEFQALSLFQCYTQLASRPMLDSPIKYVLYVPFFHRNRLCGCHHVIDMSACIARFRVSQSSKVCSSFQERLPSFRL